jgi:hypothetical protein
LTLELKDEAFTLLGWSLTVLASLTALTAWYVSRRRLQRSPHLRRALVVALSGTATLVALPGAYGLWVRYRPQPPPLTRTLFAGAEYRRISRVAPRPHVVHAVRLDLTTQGLGLVVTKGPSDECLPALKTSSFLQQTGSRLAINTHYFRSCAGAPNPNAMQAGSPVAPLGLATADGTPVVTRRWKGSTLYIDSNGRATLGKRPEHVQHAISGRRRLVSSGRAKSLSDPALAPRVSAGLNAARDTLLLVVVDGRQRGYSEGLSLSEMANLMLELGAHDAIELDGGGSATLVERDAKGSPHVLNSPIHARIPGQERPVSSHLGVTLSSR